MAVNAIGNNDDRQDKVNGYWGYMPTNNQDNNTQQVKKINSVFTIQPGAVQT